MSKMKNRVIAGVLGCMMLLTGCGKKVATVADFRSDFGLKKYKISKLDVSDVPSYFNGADLNHIQVASKGENFVMFLDYEDEDKAVKGMKAYVKFSKENSKTIDEVDDTYWSGYCKDYEIATVASRSKNTLLVAMRSGEDGQSKEIKKVEKIVEEFGYGK